MTAQSQAWGAQPESPSAPRGLSSSRRVTRAPSGDRRPKEQAGVGAAKPQSLGSQLPTMMLVPRLLGTGSHGASLDSSKRRNGLRLLAEGLHNRVTRKLETSVGGFMAIFHSVPQTPDDRSAEGLEQLPQRTQGSWEKSVETSR